MSETLQILEKVNAFYAQSFNQLIVYTGALLAMVGVLLPLFIALQQAKQAKRDQEQLSRVIDEKFEKSRAEFAEFLKTESAEIHSRLKQFVEATNAEVSLEMKRIDNESQGSIFHVQARQYIDQGFHGHAAISAFCAAKHYARAQAELNLTAVFVVMESALEVATKAQMEAAEKTDPRGYAIFREAVQKLNETGRYTRELRNIEAAYEAAKSREPTKRDVARSAA